LSVNILSLFDGISCGQYSFQNSDINVDKYYAVEVDTKSMAVSRFNFPDTIFIGDVRELSNNQIPFVDILIGGSPCQNLSFAGKQKGTLTSCNIEITTLDQYLELKNDGFEFEGQSYLFWEYLRILKQLQKRNPNLKFLLENVKMAKKWENIFNVALGMSPIEIDSALLSAQSRKRLYWTNFSKKVIQPKDSFIYVEDILENLPFSPFPSNMKYINKGLPTWNKDERVPNVFTGASRGRYLSGHSGKTAQFLELRFGGKSNCLTTVDKDNFVVKYNFENDSLPSIRKLSSIEYERLQTLPDNYTLNGLTSDGEKIILSDNQRKRMIGNSWTATIITHLIKQGDFNE